MELLTIHLGADFDALALWLLARKLHPEARVFLPGSKEESVRRRERGVARGRRSSGAPGQGGGSGRIRSGILQGS
ncbi:MAG: hypothetical protein ACOC7L_04245 [Acidobacteriota bacterium]